MIFLMINSCVLAKKNTTIATSTSNQPITLNDINYDFIKSLHQKRTAPTPNFHSETQSELNNLKYSIQEDKKNINDDLNYNKQIGQLSRMSSQGVIRSFEHLDHVSCDPKTATQLFAHAVVSEKYFPEEEFKEISLLSYAKAFDCGNEDVKIRSGYRFALNLIEQNNCEAAKPYLAELRKDSVPRVFQSRALYWSLKCDTHFKLTQEEIFKKNPNSFHTIQLFNNDKEQEISKYIFNKPNPVFVFQITDDRKNNLIYLIEEKYLENDFDSASKIMQLIRQDTNLDLTSTELLYLAKISSLSNDDLSAFNFISKAIHTYPDLKTKDVLNVFYPFKYSEIIHTAAEENKIDPYLIMALIRQESAFNPNARSRVGARGLMQLMPPTAKLIDRSLKKSDLYTPEKNIPTGVHYLARLIDRYNGNIQLALAAYNAGPLNVDQWLKRYPLEPLDLFIDLIPFQETREYVTSIQRNYYWYQKLYPEFKKSNLTQKLTSNY